MSPFGPYASFDDCVAKNGDKSSPKGFCAWLEHQITGAWPGQMADGLPFPAVLANEYAKRLEANEFEPNAWKAAVKLAEDAGWRESRFGWIQQFQAPKMKTVANVTIFATGSHTDSAGQTREWTDADLDRMVEAFIAHVPPAVPLKCGHTSDAFNQKVAEALGCAVENVTGDMGQGRISIGNMIALEKLGHLLVATFDHVPEPIANLIEGGQYATVSCEVEDAIGDFGPVTTGVALLGAEEPAIAAATLDRALVFGGARKGARVLTFAVGEDIPAEELRSQFKDIRARMSDAVKGLRGAPFFRTVFDQIDELFEGLLSKRNTKHQAGDTDRAQKNPASEGGHAMKNLTGAFAEMTADAIRALSLKDAADKFQEGQSPAFGDIIKAFQEADLAPIVAALGLGEGATIEDAVAAIEALKQAAAAAAQAPAAGEMKSEFAKMATRITALETENGKLKHDSLVSKYQAITSTFKAIEGKPEDLAEELATKHEKVGEAIAQAELGRYQKADGIQAEAMKVVGSKRDGEPVNDFETAVTKYMKDNEKATRVDAIKVVSKERPDLWYQRDDESVSS